MGNKHSRRSDKAAEFQKKYGCDHYDDDTVIKGQRWKVVPMTSEESKMVLRRMRTICEDM